MASHPSNDSAETTVQAPNHAQPNYLYVYLSLVVLTLMELGVIYLPLGRAGIILILVAFALAKLAIVVMYYMHLKFEPRLYTWVFIAPLPFVAMIAVAVWFLSPS
jgi:cytochrome c oxidase subunit 4